jgi:hypothetical protein
MRIYPLLYVEHFTDDEIKKQGCSDRIWLGQRTFESYMRDAEPGIVHMLEIVNGVDQRTVGCIYGVHHGDEDVLYVPQWMYDELLMDDAHITLRPISPSPCTGLMIQPHTSDHVHAEDPQELLREAFEQYSCLTPDTTIPLWLESQQKQVQVTIMEVRPHTGETRCIRNCEIELELMRPLDMPLPALAPTAALPEPASASAPASFAGAGCVLDPGIAVEPTADRRQMMAEAARRRLKNTSASNPE